MVKVTELIEMGDKNVFNTTGSQLWKKVVLLFDAELKAQYSLMRQDRFTVDNIMKYLYGEQISQIPATFYNKDMQSKYLNFGSSYLYALHGSGEQHIRKWIRERLMYCDTLLGYRASSSDYITLRSSKLGEVYLDVETYIPMYLSIKWRDEANNTGLQTKRVGRGEKVRFTYNMPTATDQEIIVYAGHYLKSLGDVSNLQPTSMLIANADRLTEITCHSPNLINTDLSECTKLQRIDLSDCTALGTGIGAQPILNIQNCKYLRYCDCRNTQLTAIYTMQAGGNLEEIYYPQSTQVVQLTNQTYLHTIGLPSTNPCENLADVQITNCNAVKSLSSETIALDFNTFKYVQNLNITNSLIGLNSMQFNGFDKLRNVTLSSLKELDSIGFEDMMPVTTTSTLKNITISDCPLITSLSFNVSSDDYKVAFASNGKLDLGGLQSLKSIECNTSVKGLDTLIVPTSLTDLRFTTEYGDGINEIKNIWSASAVHNNDGFEGIDFQDMTIEFIDMLGLNSISNAINFHIAPKTQNPNLNTARDGSASKPWFHPIGSIDLSNYTGLMIGMLRGVDLNKLDVVINTDRDQVDLTSLFECATLPTAQNIVTKTNNILAKFPKSVIWDYMFKGCDLSFSPKDIRIPNRGLSLKGMYKDSNVTEDVSLPNVIMAVDEMFMNCTGITTYEKNWLKTYSKITYTVPTSNGTSGSWDDSGNYTEGTNYNQFLYTPSDGEKAFKIMTTGTGVVRINYFYNASFISRIVYTPEFDSYPYVVTIPDGCNKVIFVCDKTIRFASEGTITTNNCYTNTGGALSEIPTSWGGYGLDKNVTSIYIIDTTLLTNTTIFNLVLNDSQAGVTDWGDGVTNSEKSHTYAEHGVYTIKTKSWANGVPSDDLKTALIEIKQIKLIGHNGNSKDYSNSFDGCTNLRKVTAYDLAPTDCGSMFNGCSLLTELVGLDTWDMSNCIGIGNMFYGTGLTDPTPVYNMLSTFTGSSADSLFRGSKIESIELERFPNTIKDFSRIAWGCTNLKTIDFTNCVQDTTSWESAFRQVKGVTSMIGLETLNASDGVILENMFAGTDLSNVGTIDMSGMTCKIRSAPSFTGTKVTTIKMGFNWVNITNGLPNYMFYDFNTLENVEWGINLKSSFNDYTGFKNHNNLTVQSLLNLFTALYDFSTEGGTHYIDIGATNIAKLTREQMLIAIKKHWTIQGAPIQGVFRDTDISALTSDDTVTAVAIELTSSNYKTRIDEVLGVYTNAVDVYFFEDGSVTTLQSMFYSDHNATYDDRIQNITFLDGYFQNRISLRYAFSSGLTSLQTIKLPKNISNLVGAFKGCSSLRQENQEFDISEYANLEEGLQETFLRCNSLTSVILPNGFNGHLSQTFRDCHNLKKVTGYNLKPINCDNMFTNCSSLTDLIGMDTWDMSNCTSCLGMFSETSKLTSLHGIENWVLSRCTTIKQMFGNSGITSLDVSNWGMGACTDMSIAFNWANDLTSIVGLDNWDISSCTNFNTMFNHCISLVEINLSNWNFTNVNAGFFSNCTSLTKITLNNIVDNSTREAGVGLRNVLNSIPQPVEIVMNEFAMTDFSNLFQGVTKIKNDIVFPSTTTNVSNCFKDCTGITHIHSNWKTTYDDIVAEDGTVSKIVTTDCYAGCTGVTHCDGVACEELDEVPITWGGFGFSKATTSILELVIPENNYTLTLNPDMILATIDNGEHSGYDIYNRINWGDGTITEGEHSHTYTTAGTYIFKGHYYMGAYEPTATLKVCLSKIHQIPRYYKSSFYNHRFLAKDCKNLTEVTINNFVTTPNNNGLLQAFNGCTNLQKVTITADMPLYNLRDTFRNCTSLVEINGIETWDTSTTKEMYGAFYNCSQLPYSVLLQLSNVLDFSSCASSTNALENMFNGVTFDDAVPLQQLNVSPIRSARGMLTGIKVNGDLDLSMWNVHPTNLESFLNSAIIKGTVNLSGWDVSSCTSFRRMLHLSDTPSVNLSGWDFSGCTDMDYYTFIGCSASDWNFTGASGIKFNIDINNSVSQNWSVDSLVGLFNALYDFASAGDTGTHTIQIGNTNLAKLTAEQIAIATNKGWTVSA